MKAIGTVFLLLMFVWLEPALARDVCNCKGYSGPGGPCYAGPGGPAYDGPGGPAYSGPGGPCYRGAGGPRYDGPGGPSTLAREAHAIAVPVALRMMVLEDRHIQDQAVRATRVPVVHAIQVPGEQANDVHRFANNTLFFSTDDT